MIDRDSTIVKMREFGLCQHGDWHPFPAFTTKIVSAGKVGRWCRCEDGPEPWRPWRRTMSRTGFAALAVADNRPLASVKEIRFVVGRPVDRVCLVEVAIAR